MAKFEFAAVQFSSRFLPVKVRECRGSKKWKNIGYSSRCSSEGCEMTDVLTTCVNLLWFKVRYTGYRDRPQEERQVRFQNGCREGHTEIAFAATGTNLQLVFGNASGNYAVDPCDCDFDKEHGKVHLRSHLIMNGVCVRWRGWIDLDRLDGVGCLEYDEERAAEEDALLRDQLERYNQRLRDFEEKQRAYRSGAASAAQPPHLNHHYHHDTHHAASHHHHHHGHHSRHVGGAGATGATATGIEPHLPHRQDPEMEVRLRAY